MSEWSAEAVQAAIWALEDETGQRLPDADGEDGRIMRAVLAAASNRAATEAQNGGSDA